MNEVDARALVTAARVARLGTTGPDGRPHLVPIVFALVDDALYTCVDDKPKSTRRLRRLRNIENDPRVAVLVDHYDDDWSRLWWVRLDGTATVHDPRSELGSAGLAALAVKYAQYRAARPSGPVLRIDGLRWRSWSAGGGSADRATPRPGDRESQAG